MKQLISSFLFLAITFLLSGQNYDIYVSDAGNFNNPPWQILKFDSNGENPEVFIDEELAWPQDILFLEDDILLISNLSSGQINRHSATNGAYLSTFASGIGGPTRMKIGPDGYLYVLQWSGNGKVLRYDLTGTIFNEFTDIGVSQSIGLDWDSDGNLYVSSYNGDSVEKFDQNGVSQGLFIDSNLLGPTNIWFDENGDLLVVDYNGNSVKRFDSDGIFLGDFIEGLGNAEGVAFYPNGDILLGNGANSAVKRFDSNGTFIEDFISSGSGNLLNPNAVVLRASDATAITESKAKAPIITPTVGDQFRISTSLKTIEFKVFDTSGKLICRHGKSREWDARKIAEGVYIIHLITQSGLHFSHQLVIQH